MGCKAIVTAEYQGMSAQANQIKGKVFRKLLALDAICALC